MFKTGFLLLSGLILASSAQALVTDGSQAILTTHQFHTGETSDLGTSTNTSVAYREEASANSLTRIDVDWARGQFGVLAGASSTGSQVYAYGSASYYEVVTFAAPAGGADIQYSVSIDGLFTAPTTLDATGSVATARGTFYAVDVTGRSPFKEYGGGSFGVADYGNNTTCLEISVRRDLAEMISGCGTGRHSFVEGDSQGRSLSVASNALLHVENGHRYLFISALQASATAQGPSAFVETDLTHTFRFNVQTMGGASVLSANGPMFATALAVPEPESGGLLVAGVVAMLAIKRRGRRASAHRSLATNLFNLPKPSRKSSCEAA